MSQKTSRKGVVTDEKEKRQIDSPVKDMKKKMAANAEKEKQAVEKSNDKPEKPTEKSADKSEKVPEKKTDKVEKKPEAEKKIEKNEKKQEAEKKIEKNEKKQETEKKIEKNDKKLEAEKKDDSSNKDDKAAKPDKANEAKSSKPKHNGNARVNGATNGDHNGTVSAPDDEDEDGDEDDEGEGDEMFPELKYDDTSDPEFEPDAPHGRSITRRSQAKVTRTPETPRPASDRHTDAADDSKDSKVLKLKEDVPSTDRKLRSADSPKPEPKKQQENKQEPAKKPESQESPKKPQETQDKPQETKKVQESPKKQQESPKKTDKDNKDEKENGDGNMGVVEVVVEIEDEEEHRKTDTNFSKSRVKVSPYRRSMRADQTHSSTMANYTGNNTTMEMDITESSFVSTETSLDDSSYLSGLRNIRGRRSYKPLKEMTLRHLTEKHARPDTSGSGGEAPSRPTGTVVGRKRKPDADAHTNVHADAHAHADAHTHAHADTHAYGKRLRLLDRLAHTLRRTSPAAPALPALPAALPARSHAEIVGINTDLPLTAPVAAADSFDPETLKAAPVAVPLPHTAADKDGKKCIVM